MFFCLHVQDVKACLTQNYNEWVEFFVEVRDCECIGFHNVCRVWFSDEFHSLPVMYEAHVSTVSYKELILVILKQETGIIIFKDHCLSLFIIRLDTFTNLINLESSDKISFTFTRLVI